MAGLPQATDPALAALSTQLPTVNPAGGEEDEEEHLAVRALDLHRRESGAASFRSEYTSATGGNSVYESAAEGSFAGSRATLDTLQPSASERSFNEAQSQIDPSSQDLTLQQPATDLPPPIAGALPAQHGVDASTSSASAQSSAGQTPTGTVTSHPSTIRPTVLPKLSPASSETKARSHDEKRDAHSGESSEKGKLSKKGEEMENEGADEVIVDEMAGLPEDYRKVLQEQIHIEKRPPAKFFELFRFATKFEIFLNILGLLAAIVAGAAQPLMTVVFGALTTSFTTFTQVSRQQQINPSPDGPAQLQRAVDALFVEVDKDVLYLVYIGIGMFVATFIYQGTWIYTGEANTRRVREAYLRAVLRQNVAWTDAVGAGEVTTRIETDTHLIQEGISDKISMIVMFLATFVTGFVVAFIRNWRLALVVSTIVPCIAIAGAMMNKFVSEFKRQMLEETARGATLAEEVISSVRNTHAFGTQKRLADMYDVSNMKTLQIGIKSAIANGAGLGVFFFIIYGSYGLAFYYGTTLILQGRANSGQIVSVFFSILIGAFSLAQMAPLAQSVSFALAAATSIFSTIDRVPVIDSSSPNGLSPEKVEGVIEVTDLDFIYPSRPSVQVLYKFNAVFPRGKMTALVGGSGSGKSTIIGLIERFYDPVAGSIKLDGNELKDLNVRWLRSQIGLVSQEPTLFATTVLGNILHGLIGTPFEHESDEQKRARAVEAAVQANADGFITALPEGYDTLIGERGMLLSGGQKQRIAIARAVVGDPAILLLDEATSALDTASEGLVQSALDRASKGRTTITIAHRLSTIKDADQIIVLTAGHILEKASTSEEGLAHDILLKNPDGAYSKLVNAQKFKEEEEAEAANDDDSTDEKAPAPPGELTNAQVEEMARNEKPQFENLKRTGTGRSAASEALEQKHQNDLEAGRGKQHNFIYLIKRMLWINRASWLDYVLAVAASIVAGCVYPIFGIVFGGAIQAFSYDPVTQRPELRAGGDRNALYCFIIAIVATIAIIIQNLCFGRSVEHLSRTLRLRTFSSILRSDIAFFDRDENSTGHLVSVIADWAQKIAGLFGVTAGVILQSIFTIIVGAVIGLSYAWRLSLVGIACIPLTIAAGIVRLKVVVLKDQKNKKSHEKSAQMACEAAGAIRTVASLTREEDVNRIYSEQLDEPMQVSNRTALYSNAFYSLSQSLSFWVIGLIFWYGSHQIVDRAIDTRQFFIAMISIVFGSIQAGNVFSFVPDMSKARGAASDVVNLLDSVPEIDAEDPSGKPFDKCTGHIRFKDVHFRYPTRPHVRVLRGLDLEVLPGQMAAIVGPSGCGKSTLIQLVERFYDPLAGEVQVDGQDISELNVQSYRKSISLVSQEPTLYAGTVRFNITLGATTSAEAVTQEQVEQACKDANIHDFVMSLPDGYDTEVGGKGTQLSGGQKQRIAIARALVRDPRILLLDEATSALDSESERVVQTALDQAAKGRTTIAVAHRLSTIQAADIIYVLRDGKVAEKGKHFELLAKKGIYHELVAQQDLAAH